MRIIPGPFFIAAHSLACPCACASPRQPSRSRFEAAEITRAHRRLSPLLGKPLAIISDARLGSAPSHTVVERLLSITGEDMLTVDRKYREPYSGRLPTRFVMLSNELPRFTDASGAIATRMLILQLTNSFLNREDRTIEAVWCPICRGS